MTTEPKFEYKFERQWGGEDTWYTKGKRWANKQKFPINHLALGFIEWLWKHWIDGRVEMEMTSVDKQAEEIKESWESEDGDQWTPVIKSEPSEVGGLDIIEIKNPWNSDGDT